MPEIQDSIPAVLSIAGSDCSSGAGAQADLKTFSAHGVFGLTSLTCVVAEIPGKVSRIDLVDPESLAEQLRLLLASFPVTAIKTGMIPSAAHVEKICCALNSLNSEHRPWLVVDPVMVATSGDQLVGEAVVDSLKGKLFPKADLLTPNMDEASVLLNREVLEISDLENASRELSQQFGCAVLVKGGHLSGSIARDCLCTSDGEVHHFDCPYLPNRRTHGTGCTLSAAITSNLALNGRLVESVEHSKQFVYRAIDHMLVWNHNSCRIEALNHFAQPE